MANYKRKLPALKFTTWDSILATIKGLNINIENYGRGENQKGLWQRLADLIEICDRNL